MKRVNKLRISLYKDIFMTLLLVLVSIPIWLSFDVSDIPKEDNHIRYSVLNNPQYMLDSVSDEYALRNIETQDIIVSNYTNNDIGYSLVLKIDKKSTIQIEDIKLNVNYSISYLRDFISYEDTDYYYFIIDSDHIQGDSQTYILSMWNDENKPQRDNNLFDYEFVIL